MDGDGEEQGKAEELLAGTVTWEARRTHGLPRTPAEGTVHGGTPSCLERSPQSAGLHDEALQGNRKGQRSIRLSQAYRAIYVIVAGAARFVRVEEVNKHRY